MAGLSAGIALTILIGLLGSSAMVPGLAGPSWQPPYSLGLDPGPHLVIALAATALGTGTLGLAAGLAALGRGWAPDARRLVLVGCSAAAVLAFLPPSGSADHLNYAAYGRIAVLGLDPYVTTPDALPGDPVADAVEEWRDTPSVYGPVATGVQAVASLLGGESVRLTVFGGQVVNAAAFIAAALLLHRFAAPADRPRAALLWAANPLMIYHLAAGTHVDTLAVAGVVAALVTGGTAGWTSASAPRLAVAGSLLGLAVAVKVNAGLAALGPAWALRPWRTAQDDRLRSRRSVLGRSGTGWFGVGRLVVVAGVAFAVAAVAYLLAGPHSLDRVLEASRMVSLGTPWSLVKGWLQALFGPGAYRSWIQVGSLLLLVAVAAGLLRALREPYRVGERSAAAPGVAVVIVAAWLVATPYALPWYDGLLFALLALVPATALDGFAVARLAVLSLGYLPARQAGRTEDLAWLVTGVRASLVPWVLLGLTVVLLGWAWRAEGRVRTRPTSAAPRP